MQALPSRVAYVLDMWFGTYLLRMDILSSLSVLLLFFLLSVEASFIVKSVNG